MTNDQILTFEASENPFKTIYVDITHRCQMACANCYLPNRIIPDMDADKLMSLLQCLPSKTDIRLVGGEPTLRDDLSLVIKRITDLGHRAMLITNGLKLADLKYCQELKDAGLSYVQVSLNGFDDDNIYQVLDKMKCAKEKMMAVENCDKVGLGLSVSTILVKNLNDHLVGKIISYMKERKKGVRVNFRNVGDLGRNMSKSIDNLTFEDLIELASIETQVPQDEIRKCSVSPNQIRFSYQLGTKRSEKMWIKLTDWQNYPFGITSKEDIVRKSVKGRVSQDFKLVPFFEHVKKNEFGY